MELLEKLAALVPPPGLHLVRYQGAVALDQVAEGVGVAGDNALDEAAVAVGGKGVLQGPGPAWRTSTG